MAERPAVNASPLIYLAAADLLNFLQLAGPEILDDLAARRCAATLRIPVRGTLGLVLLAKQRGRITAARPALERMRESGMYLSASVLNRALGLVGE